MSAPLAPGFLIASPPLGDPNFDRTVVLLALHGDQGALGFVVNRAAPMSAGELLSLAGYGEEADERGGEGGPPVYVGGPVQPSSGWVLTRDASPDAPARDDAGEGVLRIGDRIRITSSRQAFDLLARDVRAGAPTSDRIVLLGYSGWGPGQLEGEIAGGAWLPVPFDDRILFDVAVGERWERAYALLGLTPAGMISMRSAGQA